MLTLHNTHTIRARIGLLLTAILILNMFLIAAPPALAEGAVDVQTIKAYADGVSVPPTGPNGTSVRNRDFLITDTGVNTTVGNGIDEETTWDFNFRDDIPPGVLESAELLLIIEPRNAKIDNDIVRIRGLPEINASLIQNLKVGNRYAITMELLDFYEAGDIIETTNIIVEFQ